MDFAISPDLQRREHADMLVIPFWKNKKVECAADIGSLKKTVFPPIDTEDFQGKEGEVLIIYPEAAQKERRIALLGLGDKEKITVEKLRRSLASFVKACRKYKIKEINIILPKSSSLSNEEVLRGIAEGLLLSNYTFDKLKGSIAKEKTSALLSKTTFIGLNKNEQTFLKKCLEICKGVHFVRDLVNENADTMTPEYLAQIAKDIAKKAPHMKATVFDKQRIVKENMGLVHAVGRGSIHPPTFIILEYKGNPKSRDHTVLVGKGVTYDTGGLDLKNVAGFGTMESMKCDMGGAATVLGVIYTAANLGLKENITVVIPAVENAISGSSFKPGDVYQSYLGKTVEITSTDAEGRLILADAIAYASKKLKPSRIIDFATLTGGIDIALGSELTGLMSNDDGLANAMISSGESSGERLWRLPLVQEYRELLKSEVADLKNTAGRSASSIKAAIFLQEFLDENIPWAHCDIASTAFLPESLRYHPRHATGICLRLMIDFFENKARRNK